MPSLVEDVLCSGDGLCMRGLADGSVASELSFSQVLDQLALLHAQVVIENDRLRKRHVCRMESTEACVNKEASSNEQALMLPLTAPSQPLSDEAADVMTAPSQPLDNKASDVTPATSKQLFNEAIDVITATSKPLSHETSDVITATSKPLSHEASDVITATSKPLSHEAGDVLTATSKQLSHEAIDSNTATSKPLSQNDCGVQTATSKPLLNEDMDILPLPPEVPWALQRAKTYPLKDRLKPDFRDGICASSDAIEQERLRNSRNELQPDKNLLHRVVKSSKFQVVFAVLVALNCFVLMVELQLWGRRVGFKVGYANTDASAEAQWASSQQYFEWIEIFFVVAFACEFIVRVIVEREACFFLAQNYVDLTVVCAGVIGILPGLSLMNANFLRALRVTRYLRALRLFSFHASGDSMRLLLKALESCVSTLAWSFALLSVVQVVAAMLMVQLVSLYLESTTDPETTVHLVYSYYGTFTRAFLTMYEIFLANWAPSCRVLIDHVSEFYSFFFILYRCVVGFAVLNVINAVFVQQTIKVATADHEIMVTQKTRLREDYACKLRHLFSWLDISGDGHVSWDEFCVALSDPCVKDWMNALEIDAGDMHGLFRLLDDGDGQIDVDEFIRGATRLRGLAKNIDMVYLMEKMRKLDRTTSTVLGLLTKETSPKFWSRSSSC